MKWFPCLIFLAAVTCVVCKPTLYEKTEDEKLHPIMIPVSSTVIPLDELPVYKVGFGFKIKGDGGFISEPKYKPDGPFKLLTAVPKQKKTEVAKVHEVTEEEFKSS